MTYGIYQVTLTFIELPPLQPPIYGKLQQEGETVFFHRTANAQQVDYTIEFTNEGFYMYNKEIGKYISNSGSGLYLTTTADKRTLFNYGLSPQLGFVLVNHEELLIRDEGSKLVLGGAGVKIAVHMNLNTEELLSRMV